MDSIDTSQDTFHTQSWACCEVFHDLIIPKISPCKLQADQIFRALIKHYILISTQTQMVVFSFCLFALLGTFSSFQMMKIRENKLEVDCSKGLLKGSFWRFFPINNHHLSRKSSDIWRATALYSLAGSELRTKKANLRGWNLWRERVSKLKSPPMVILLLRGSASA